jgi:dephospho-CoA kinase
MKIIGVVGKIGSGKDELAQTLKRRCGIPILSPGDIARHLAEEQGIEKSRSNLHELSQRAIEHHGKDYFIKQIIEEIESQDWQAVSITGIRQPLDHDLLRDNFGEDFILIRVEVNDPILRFKRLLQRNRPRDPQSYAEFLQQEREEESEFHLSRTLEEADLILKNNGSLEEFHRSIQKHVINPLLSNELDCNGNR